MIKKAEQTETAETLKADIFSLKFLK